MNPVNRRNRRRRRNFTADKLGLTMSRETLAKLHNIYAPITRDIELLGRFMEEEFKSSEPFIYEILQHISRFRGKQIRPALLFLATRLTGGKVTSEVIKIGGVLELIHTATLVHDDLLDGATLRRRVDTVHKRWGERPAILIGDFIYSRAFQLSTEVPGMAQVLSVTSHTICEGELLQVGTRHDSEISEEIYFEIIRKKTAVLYAVACELGGVFSGLGPEECDLMWSFGMDLGMAFQIVDDCLDYSGRETVAGKSLGTDLRKGKLTLPLIYLRDSVPPPEKEWLLKTLRTPLSSDAERHIQEMVHSRGVLPEAFGCAEGYIQSAQATLATICKGDAAGNGRSHEKAVRESLELVAEYVLRRQR